jgi:hypothetical protein
LEDLGRTSDASFDLGLWYFLVDQAKPEILVHAHMRIKGVRLKYHRDASRRGQEMITTNATDVHFAGAQVFKPGNHPQQGRFPAPGGADEHGEGSVFDR